MQTLPQVSNEFFQFMLLFFYAILFTYLFPSKHNTQRKRLVADIKAKQEADKKEKEFQIWQLRRQIEDAKASTVEMTALDAELAKLKEEAQQHNITPTPANAPPPPPPPPPPRRRNPNAMDTS